MSGNAIRASALVGTMACLALFPLCNVVASTPRNSLEQEPTPPPAQPILKNQTANPHPISRSPLRMALPRRTYLCDGGARVVILFETSAARLTLNDHIYNMKLLESASTTKYGEGSVVWSSTGEDGFLADNSDPTQPRMLAENCQLQSAYPAVAPTPGSITGSVSPRQPVDLPSDAVILIHLQDMTRPEAPSPFLAEYKTTLGARHLPIPFTLHFDPAKVDPSHVYLVEAKILSHGQVRLISEIAYPVLTQGHPARVDLILVPSEGRKAARP